MSLRAFIAELRQGLPEPVYLFYGPEPFWLYEARQMLKGLVPPEAREFACLDMDASEPEFSLPQALEALRSIPFLGKRMVLCLQNVQALKVAELKRLRQYVEAPVRQNLLALFALSKRPPLRCPRTFHLRLSEGEMVEWLRHRATGEGLVLSQQAAACLLELTGQEPGLAASELGKLSGLGKRHIEVEDIRALCRMMGQHSAFELAEAFRRRDAELALRVCQDIEAATDVLMALGALNAQVASDKRLGPREKYRAFQLLKEANLRARTSAKTFRLQAVVLRLLRI